MIHHSVQQRDRTFVEGYGFLSFAKNMGRNISKKLSSNTVRNALIMRNSLLEMHLKLLQKESFKKQQKQPVI